MTDVKTFEQYKLKVGWPRLSEITNNPEKTNRSLVDEEVIAKMRRAKGALSLLVSPETAILE